MPKTLLYLNGQLVDLRPGTVIALTFKGLEIGDLRTRSANYTNQFQLPKTPTNNRIFEHVDNLNSMSSLPYSTLSARVVQDGLEVISNGVAYLTETEDFFNITIYSGVRDFFDQLGEGLISDLDTNDINAAFNAAYIESRAAATSDVVCPVIDYGKLITGTTDLNAGFYLPSFYYKDIIGRIISAAGYTKSGNVLTDTKYTKMIIPFSRDSFSYTDSFRKAKEFSAAAPGTQVINLSAGVSAELSFSNILFNGSDNYFNGVRYNPPGLNYFYYYHLYSELVLSITVTGTVTISVTMRANSSTYDSSDVISTSGTYTVVLRSPDTVSFIAAGGGVDPKRIQISQTSGSGSAVVTVTLGRFYNEVLGYVDRGNKVFFGQLLPDISKKEFIKDFLIRFGLLVKEQGSQLIFKGIEEIITDRSGAVNWTNKRDVSGGEKVTYELPAYTQTNKFTYAETDNVNKDTGKGVLTMGSANQETSSFVDSIFKPSRMEARDGIYMAIIPVYAAASTDANTFDNAPGNRIALVRDRYSGEGNVIYSTSISAYTVGYFEDPQTTNQMGWQSFIDKHYKSLSAALQKPKVVTRYYVLNAMDIATLDLFKLVYDNGGYYLISSIENYIPGQSAKVVLFKVG